MAPTWRHNDTMDLLPYVDQLRRELAVAAETGGEEARALAERLTAPLESALRLVLLEALVDAADEITRDLAPGSVEVRLRGRDPDFVVNLPLANPPSAGEDAAGIEPASASPSVSGSLPGIDEGELSRISLRLPEGLKVRVEEAAAKERLSVNAWLVRAVAGALVPEDHDRRGPPVGRRYTGWVR